MAVASVLREREALLAVELLQEPAWSELVGCLARAFLPPPAALAAGAWCSALADDLDDLGPLLGIDVASAVTRLRGVAASPSSSAPWLVEYSQLFLVPPVRVPLNTGIYLEGGIGGSASQMMAQCYAAAGYAQCEAFHDLPDHVAIQLEFVAALLARAEQSDDDAAERADEFVDSFVLHWAAPLRAACAKAADEGHPAAGVYAALAQLLEDQLDSPRALPQR